MDYICNHATEVRVDVAPNAPGYSWIEKPEPVTAPGMFGDAIIIPALPELLEPPDPNANGKKQCHPIDPEQWTKCPSRMANFQNTKKKSVEVFAEHREDSQLAKKGGKWAKCFSAIPKCWRGMAACLGCRKSMEFVIGGVMGDDGRDNDTVIEWSGDQALRSEGTG
jgi:hypothetical protein